MFLCIVCPVLAAQIKIARVRGCPFRDRRDARPWATVSQHGSSAALLACHNRHAWSAERGWSEERMHCASEVVYPATDEATTEGRWQTGGRERGQRAARTTEAVVSRSRAPGKTPAIDTAPGDWPCLAGATVGAVRDWPYGGVRWWELETRQEVSRGSQAQRRDEISRFLQ